MLIICLLVCLSTPRASWHILVVPKTMPSSSSPFSSSTPLSSVPNNAKEETTTGTYPKDGCPPRITSGAKRSEYQSWGVWASRQASQDPLNQTVFESQDSLFNFISLQMSSLSNTWAKHRCSCYTSWSSNFIRKKANLQETLAEGSQPAGMWIATFNTAAENPVLGLCSENSDFLLCLTRAKGSAATFRNKGVTWFHKVHASWYYAVS